MITTKQINEKFASMNIPVTESGCWLWLGSCRPKGYGRLRVSGQYVSAHRLAYVLFRGPIPDGLYVCHSCDIKCCVNPDHLWLGTNKENLDDAVRKGIHGKNLHRGEKHYATTLTPAIVQTIRTLASQGHTHQAIADKFRLQRRHISKIVSRTTWAHLP